MGPPGLWAELRRQGAAKCLAGPEVELLLEGKIIAVDGAVWLYEAQTQADLVRAYGAEGAALKVTFERCVRWLRKGVLPVVVLEGNGGGRASRTFSRGWGILGSAFAPQPKIRTLLVALGIPCVDAEGEGEATCAALVASGDCDFVATTDFDALLFGASRVLRDLDLLQGVQSKCELWEADTIERVTGLNRDALVAAAFLLGCDYDCRNVSKSTKRDGQGVRGVGVRQALKIAGALSVESGGKALAGLSSMVLDMYIPEGSRHGSVKKSQEKPQPGRSLSRTMSLPELSTSGIVKHDKEQASTRRLLSRTMSRAAEDPMCKEGFSAAVRQYNRVVGGATSSVTGERPFRWSGVNDADAALVLSRVFPGRAAEKLDPLHLEWALRVVAAECPPIACTDPVKRRKWAAERGLRYVPLSAKRPNQHKSSRVPYVLVEFALAKGDTGPLRLDAKKKHARVSLAEACRLLDGSKRRSVGMRKQASLKDMFQKTAAQNVDDVGSARRKLSIRARRFTMTLGKKSLCVAQSPDATLNSTLDSDFVDPQPDDTSITKTIDSENPQGRVSKENIVTAVCLSNGLCPSEDDQDLCLVSGATLFSDGSLQDAATSGRSVRSTLSRDTIKQNMVKIFESPALPLQVCSSQRQNPGEVFSFTERCFSRTGSFDTPTAPIANRDTTKENIAKFFGSSTMPMQTFSSQSQDPATCIDLLLAVEMPERMSEAPAENLTRESVGQAPRTPKAMKENHFDAASPTTPMPLCRALFSAATPEKRSRAVSLGGFCRPEEDVGDSMEDSAVLKSDSVLSSSPQESVRQNVDNILMEAQVATKLSRHQHEQLQHVPGKRARSNMEGDSHHSFVVTPMVVDLTAADSSCSESDDELPLSLLVSRSVLSHSPLDIGCFPGPSAGLRRKLSGHHTV